MIEFVIDLTDRARFMVWGISVPIKELAVHESERLLYLESPLQPDPRPREWQPQPLGIVGSPSAMFSSLIYTTSIYMV